VHSNLSLPTTDNDDDVIILNTTQIAINSGMNSNEPKELQRDTHQHLSNEAISAFIYSVARKCQTNVLICYASFFESADGLVEIKQHLFGEITNWEVFFLLHYKYKNWKLLIHHRNEEDAVYYDPSRVHRNQRITKCDREKIFKLMNRLYNKDDSSTGEENEV
jgi:hypothetical protein